MEKITEVTDRSAKLADLQDNVEFGVKYNTESKESITVRCTFDYSDLTVGQLLLWARRAIIIAVQRRLRDSAENKKDFRNIVEQLNGRVIKIVDYIKPVKRERKPENKAKEMAKAISQVKTYSVNVAKTIYADYLKYCKENGIEPQPFEKL